MSSDHEGGSRKGPGKENKTDSIRKAIHLFEEKLGKGEVKVSAGEYIRLLELLQQVEGDEPREIRVTWVEQRTEDQETETEKTEAEKNSET